MRLLVRSKIWCAFPELDRFSDEQCARFVKAAHRVKLLRTRDALLVGLSIGLSMVAANLSLALADRWWGQGLGQRLGDVGAFLVLGGVGVVIFGAFAIGLLVLRDRQLRTRIRYVLRARGTCAGCGYSLLGLPVPESLQVTCPECGMTGEVDPALGELAPDSGVRRGLGGNSALAPIAQRLARGARLRRWGVALAAVGAVAAVILGVLWYLSDVAVHRQVRAAQGGRRSPAELVAIALEGRPPGQLNASDRIGEIGAIAKSAQTTVESSYRAAGAALGVGEDSLLGGLLLRQRHEGEIAADAAVAERFRMDVAARIIESCTRQGMFEKLAELATLSNQVRRADNYTPGPLLSTCKPDRQAFYAANVCEGLMRRALAERNESDFLQGLNGLLTIVAYFEAQPTMADRTQVHFFGAKCLRVVHTALGGDLPDAWLGRMAQALEERWKPGNPELLVRGEGVVLQDLLAMVFGDEKNVRAGMRTQSVEFLISFDRREAPGSYEANRDAAASWIEELAGAARQTNRQRSSQPPQLAAPALVRGRLFEQWLALRGFDLLETHRRGALIMIALERWKLRHGAYPEKLAELAPGGIAALPTDPYTDGPFGYRLNDAASDPLGRGYLLWGAGTDGIDDGGNFHHATCVIFGETPPGGDLLINGIWRDRY